MLISLSRVLWSSVARTAVFWALLVATVAGIEFAWGAFDARLIFDVIGRAVDGNIEDLSDQRFAFSLAAGLIALAIALAVTFFFLHAVCVPFSLWVARRSVTRSKDMAEFASTYERTHRRMERHPLIGHAWKEFDETLVMPKDAGGVIRNTVRPQAFINLGTARERLFGLKMMGSIPGYFVGIGLLLTFAGLVLALSKAAAGVNSSDVNGMQTATRELLQVATFKFSTSIAGLGASIALSFLFRTYTIAIESAFDKFCQAVERKLRYTAPQAITAEMNETLHGQLTELKQINSADFFARMGEKLAAPIQAAFATAMAPVTTSIDQAISRLADNSQSGMSELITRFTQGVQGGAGVELRELAGTLKAMQASLLEAQRGINGTGEDFGRRMAEAAESLNRVISDAGSKLGDSSEKSQAALIDIVGALRETFERANQKVDEDLGHAAAGASARVEEAMGRVLERLEGQVDTFRAGLGGFQDSMAGHLDKTSEKVAAAQAAAVGAIGSVSGELAKAMQAGLADVMEQINGEFERFATTMRSTETTLMAQANSIREATTQSRTVADAFSQTAQDVRAASAPLLQSSDRIAGATEHMTETIARSVAALEVGQTSSKQLAEALLGHIDHLSSMWAGYAAQFERVDADLARAVASLGDATQRQGQMLADYASKVDEGFATAIERLNPFLSELNANAGDLGDAVADLKGALTRQAAE